MIVIVINQRRINILENKNEYLKMYTQIPWKCIKEEKSGIS